jgi:trimethylamine--corrinoid protein Co-methyltransferase
MNGQEFNLRAGPDKIGPQEMTAPDLLLSAFRRELWTEFNEAKRLYGVLADYRPSSLEAGIASNRMPVMDLLMEEKALYERIDYNARQVLTNIGMNIADSPEILHILMEADAIDFENTSAPFVPLKEDYVNKCLEMVPRGFAGDPGPNSFGTGGTPPFFHSDHDTTLRPATRDEFNAAVSLANSWSNVVDILSVPVQTDKSMSDYECALCMEKGVEGLKMISTRHMKDDEASYLSGRNDWLDGTSLMTSFAPMSNMVKPFMRSASAGNNILLLDLSISGASGPNTPEALLTFIHAQVMFMMILVQTIRPGTVCVHGGIPGVTRENGDFTYSSLTQPLINEAMARLNLWVTKFPSAQSGGSTGISDDLETAVLESQMSRDRMRRLGAHMLRHAFGALGNLQFFSINKLDEDCRVETEARRAQRMDIMEGLNVLPLYLPKDDNAMEAIRQFADKLNPKETDHTLQHVGAFSGWEKAVIAAEAPPEFKVA